MREMEIKFNTHFEMLVLLPALMAVCAECGEPGCGELHRAVIVEFLFWGVELSF